MPTIGAISLVLPTLVHSAFLSGARKSELAMPRRNTTHSNTSEKISDEWQSGYVQTAHKVQAQLADALNAISSLKEQPAVKEADKMTMAKVSHFFGRRWMASCLIHWLVWTSLACLMYSYHTRHSPSMSGRKSIAPATIFAKGHFDIFSDTSTCLWSLFFPQLQWASTMDAANILPFWTAFGLFAGLAFMNYVGWGIYCFGIATCCCLLWGRQRLRAKINMQHGDSSTLALDCCFVFWFPCCAIAQEARVIKQEKNRIYQAGSKNLSCITRDTQ